MQKAILSVAAVFFSAVVSAQNLADVIFNHADNDKKTWYKGQLRDKKPHGMGVAKLKDGTLYIGDYTNGVVNGYGMMLAGESMISNCKNGVAYAGNWRNGKKSGMGTCYAENGDVLYFGKFENDKPVETYPSVDEYPLKYFTLNEYDDGEKYLGEMNDGACHGYGLYAWANGDVWFGAFREGSRKGIGLYLTGDGEWVVLDHKGDECVEINSSNERKEKETYHKAVRAQVRAENLKLLAEGLNNMVAAVQTAQSIKEIRNPNTASAANGENDAEGSYGGSKSSSGKPAKSDCGSSWRTDSRTYSDFESQLIKMRTWPENYSNYASDCAAIQSKMKQIRQKWEARGCTINKSPYE